MRAIRRVNAPDDRVEIRKSQGIDADYGARFMTMCHTMPQLQEKLTALEIVDFTNAKYMSVMAEALKESYIVEIGSDLLVIVDPKTKQSLVNENNLRSAVIIATLLYLKPKAAKSGEYGWGVLSRFLGSIADDPEVMVDEDVDLDNGVSISAFLLQQARYLEQLYLERGIEMRDSGIEVDTQAEYDSMVDAAEQHRKDMIQNDGAALFGNIAVENFEGLGIVFDDEDTQDQSTLGSFNIEVINMLFDDEEGFADTTTTLVASDKATKCPHCGSTDLQLLNEQTKYCYDCGRQFEVLREGETLESTSARIGEAFQARYN